MRPGIGRLFSRHATLCALVGFTGSLAASAEAQNAPAAAACVPLPSGAVAWFRGEDDALDIVGAHTGMLNTVTFTCGRVGHAFSFDGVSSFVQIPDSSDLEGFSNVFFELWVYPEAFEGMAFAAAVLATFYCSKN